MITYTCLLVTNASYATRKNCSGQIITKCSTYYSVIALLLWIFLNIFATDTPSPPARVGYGGLLGIRLVHFQPESLHCFMQHSVTFDSVTTMPDNTYNLYKTHIFAVLDWYKHICWIVYVYEKSKAWPKIWRINECVNSVIEHRFSIDYEHSALYVEWVTMTCHILESDRVHSAYKFCLYQGN